jgi:hypothetical protein
VRFSALVSQFRPRKRPREAPAILFRLTHLRKLALSLPAPKAVIAMLVVLLVLMARPGPANAGDTVSATFLVNGQTCVDGLAPGDTFVADIALDRATHISAAGYSGLYDGDVLTLVDSTFPVPITGQSAIFGPDALSGVTGPGWYHVSDVINQGNFSGGYFDYLAVRPGGWPAAGPGADITNVASLKFKVDSPALTTINVNSLLLFQDQEGTPLTFGPIIFPSPNYPNPPSVVVHTDGSKCAGSAPTDISLSNSTIAQGQDLGAAVGTLTSTDPDPGDTFTYALVSGQGADDNGAFTIVGGSLQTNASFDYDTKSSYSIRIRTTDSGGLYFEKQFTIAITKVDFGWTVPDRFDGKDHNVDGLVDYFPPDAHGDGLKITPDFWRVDFTYKDQAGCEAGLTPTWILKGPTKANGSKLPEYSERTVTTAGDDRTIILDPATCTLSYKFFFEGNYEVTLELADPEGHLVGKTIQGIYVKDWLVVSIGDSVGSGEGAPDVPGFNPRWENNQCHRSADAASSHAAISLEAQDDKTSVTFVHLACSGAGITTGLLNPYAGFDPTTGKGDALPSQSVPGQLGKLRTLVGGRSIDALIINVGANDLGFGQIVGLCAADTNCPNEYVKVDANGKITKDPYSALLRTLDNLPPIIRNRLPLQTLKLLLGAQTLDQLVSTRLASLLPARFAQLQSALQAQFPSLPAKNIYLVQYYDPTHDENGAACTGGDGPGVMSQADYFWAYTKVLSGLNQILVNASARYGWNLVGGISDAYRKHGYCSSSSWVVSLTNSFVLEGTKDGAVHPNYTGQAESSVFVANSLHRDFFIDGKPR